jgi:ribonuclease E
MRLLARASANDAVSEINIICPPQVAHYLTNYQRKDIILIEEETKKSIVITADSAMTGDDVRIDCVNARGSKVASETGKQKRSKLKTVSLEAYLKAGNIKDSETKSSDEQPSEDETAKPKRRRRRRRSSAAKKTDETTENTDAEIKTDEPDEKPADKPVTTKKTAKKTTDKKNTDPREVDETKAEEKDDDTPKKPSRSRGRRRRSSAKKTTEKTETVEKSETAPETDNGEPDKDSTKKTAKKTAKKTSKRAKKSTSARRKPSSQTTKDAKDEPNGNDELPAVIPPSKLREEFEARRLEEQKGKPPKKTLLEAMGFDDTSDK